MRPDTTAPEGAMNCERVQRDDVIESYLLGRLSDEECALFEQHYFGCARCFDEVRVLKAIQRELPQVERELEVRTTRPVFRWASYRPSSPTGPLTVCRFSRVCSDTIYISNRDGTSTAMAPDESGTYVSRPSGRLRRCRERLGKRRGL